MKNNSQNKQLPILIVEDNNDTRQLLELYLKSSEFEVISARNGIEALAFFEKQYFPILLTDWMMPELNGLELCKTIRQKKLLRYVFIILLTAKDEEEDIITGLNAGADEYLVKPIQKRELIARLNTAKRILDVEHRLIDANNAIREMAITDPLTGSYNRCYLNERLPKEIKRSLRTNKPFSIIMCDIDHFKRVNDTYGHHTGDLVLQKFAQHIMESVRDGVDILFRFGGEAFIIFFFDTTLDNALQVAERLRRSVARIIIQSNSSQFTITASFGVAGFNCDSDQNIKFGDLIDLADKYLYECKQSGRNRVKGGLFT